MKHFLSIAGPLLLILGAIWFFQGINILPGSFMTGQTQWAVIGGGCFLVGVAFWVASRWF